jgi:L-lactate dehydrogenase complex protein LldG
MSDARTEILARVRDARPAASTPIIRSYRRGGTLPARERIRLFCERASDYRAEVQLISRSEVGRAAAAAGRARGAVRLAIPSGLPASWRPDELELIDDDELTPAELDGLDGVLTGCTVAIAETGTIALTGGPREGRRALTLIPDFHICVVEAHQVVELVPEALEILGELVARERRPLTLVSGPSATSDIELSRVEGVHGPRTLVVLVTQQAKSTGAARIWRG